MGLYTHVMVTVYTDTLFAPWVLLFWGESIVCLLAGLGSDQILMSTDHAEHRRTTWTPK